MESKGQAPLLFVLVHGNNGSPDDWTPLMKALQRTMPGNSLYFRFSSHAGRKTLIGVEELGRALVEELQQFVLEHLAQGIFRLYIVAHSLGGLVSRAALPRLLECFPQAIPLGYCSIASPHVGVTRAGGGVFKWMWKTATETTCKNFYAQTGSDLTFHSIHTHEHTLEETLLFRLGDHSGPFMRALGKVRHRTLVSSPFLDMLVPYSTSAMSAWHPYSEDELAPLEGDSMCCVWGYSRSFSPAHEQIIHRFARSGAAGRPDEEGHGASGLVAVEEGWQVDRHRFCKWPQALMQTLSQLPFRRLDVQLNCMSRWQVHDGFLKKKLRNLLPDSGVAGDEFLELLSAIIAVDAEAE